jgi:hypothetical protein
VNVHGIIYIVRPPDDDRVVYVGQTRQSLRARMNVHRQNVRGGQTSPFCCYLRELMARGAWPRFDVLEECARELLDEREAQPSVAAWQVCDDAHDRPPAHYDARARCAHRGLRAPPGPV